MPKDDIRTRILNAAGPIFAEKGYDAATVRRICQVADVNVAAINYYFGGKERLYIETVKWAHHPDGELAERIEWPAGTAPATKFRDYIELMLKRMLCDRAPWQRGLMMRELLNPTVACRELVELHFRARFGQLLEILDEVLPAEVPQHKRHQIGFSIVGQGMFYHVAGEVVSLLFGREERETHYALGQLAEHITQFTLAALGLAPALGSVPPGPRPAAAQRRAPGRSQRGP